MYQIDATDYGFRLTCSGKLDRAGVDALSYELLTTLSNFDRSFGLMIDLRDLIPLTPEVSEAIVELHAACRRLSMVRAAIIVNSPVIKGQAVQICFEADLTSSDLVVNVAQEQDWEQKAYNWLTDLTVMDTRRVLDTTIAE